MKIDVEVVIKINGDKGKVRLFMGDYMYFDSPETTLEACQSIMTNIINREVRDDY